MTILLDNVTMVQADGAYDHMFTAKKGSKNIAIIGEGQVTLSGGNPNRLQETTQGKYGLPEISVNAMLYFNGVDGFKADNLHIEDQRWAAFDFLHSKNIQISHIDFFNVPKLPNLYGILIEHGCQNVAVSEVTGRTGSHTIFLRAAEKEKKARNTDIHHVSLKNINVDPARGAIVQFYAAGGHKIHDVAMETVFDSSDFFEKKRSAAIVAIGSEAFRPKEPSKLGDIYNVSMKCGTSRSTTGIDIESSLKDARFETLLTFGDIINAIATKTNGVKLKNVVFDRVYHGAGITPNCSDSFISLQARGQKVVDLDKTEGSCSLLHYYLPNEEVRE